MNRKEFYNIVKTEGLNKYNIGDSFEIPKAANVVGCINNNGWVVYEISCYIKTFVRRRRLRGFTS